MKILIYKAFFFLANEKLILIAILVAISLLVTVQCSLYLYKANKYCDIQVVQYMNNSIQVTNYDSISCFFLFSNAQGH